VTSPAVCSDEAYLL